jgi:hypothetical protein
MQEVQKVRYSKATRTSAGEEAILLYMGTAKGRNAASRLLQHSDKSGQQLRQEVVT